MPYIDDAVRLVKLRSLWFKFAASIRTAASVGDISASSPLFSAFAITIILLGLAAGNARPARAQSIDSTPIVIIREDDIRSTWNVPYNALGGMTALAYAKQKRIPITWGVIVDAANKRYGLSWSLLKDYLDNAGGEAASHSVTHALMPTTQGYIDEIINSKPLIEANLPGYLCRSFIQPGEWTTGDANLTSFSKLDSTIGQALTSTYSDSMAYLGGGWEIGRNYYRYGLAASYCIDYPYPTKPRIESLMDIVAATPGAVFTVTMHGIQEAGDTKTLHVQADVFKAFVDRIAALRDAGKLRLMGLHDAHQAPFSDNLNHIPDSGMELSSNYSDTAIGPWYESQNSQRIPLDLVNTGGVNNSHYLRISSGQISARSANLILRPGRYEFSWYQKPEINSQPNAPLYVTFPNLSQDNNYIYLLNYVPYVSTDYAAWQKYSALVLITERYPLAFPIFVPSTNAQYGIDNVSLIYSPVDPNISPSSAAVTPIPTGFRASWSLPNDPAVKSICIRYDAVKFPTTPTEGSGGVTFDVQTGQQQRTVEGINWSNFTLMHCSIFVIKNDSSFSPPDIAIILKNSSKPAIQAAQVTRTGYWHINAQWSPPSSPAGIYQYRYAVGTHPGLTDVVAWTLTNNTSVNVGALPLDTLLYFSMQTQTPFGIWSDASSQPFTLASGIASVLSLPDGSNVDVTGTISAVFSDRFYIQQASQKRGIQILSSTTFKEGDTVTVSGQLHTLYGERYLTPASVR